MKRTAAALALAAVLLWCAPASSAWAQSKQGRSESPAADLVLKPTGGLVPAPGSERRGARMLGMSDNRDAPPPPPSKAAEFSFKRGPTEIRIRCGDDDPIKACADAALVLMDKFSTVAPDATNPAAPAVAEPPSAN